MLKCEKPSYPGLRVANSNKTKSLEEIMKLRISMAVVLLAVAAGCSSMKVNHDYDRQADFSSFKTFAWHDSGTNVADTDPLAHERFVNAVNSQLRTHGLSEVSSNPDIFVTYNAEESQQMSLDSPMDRARRRHGGKEVPANQRLTT